MSSLDRHLDLGFSFDPAPLGGDTLSLFSDWRKAGKLGFLSLPGDSALLGQSLELAASVPPSVRTVIVDGIGGSALGLRALLSACPMRSGGRRTLVVDSPDEATLESVRSGEDPSSSLLVVVTKSGTTAETLAIFLDLWEWFSAGRAEPRVVAITDPESGDLRRLAEARGWPSLPVPRNVGGRYSVLSPVGIFPAALAGVDVEGLLLGAAEALADFDEGGAESLPARIAAGSLARFRSHPVAVFFTYCDALYDTGLWFAQLWAESLGKGKDLSGNPVCTGQTPLACRGPADQHSLVQLFMEGPADKFVTILSVEKDARPLPGGFGGYPAIEWLEGRSVQELRNAEAIATSQALRERGLPVAELHVRGLLDAAAMGRLLMAYEIATVLTGLALGVNPLDQPGVERGKQLTFREMGREGYR